MTRHIPLRFQAHCVFCNDPVDTRAFGVYSLQVGWMKNRSQGGGNALALREPSEPLQWACGFCIEERQHNRVAQGRLFG
jgi:hypothetical protein